MIQGEITVRVASTVSAPVTMEQAVSVWVPAATPVHRRFGIALALALAVKSKEPVTGRLAVVQHGRQVTFQHLGPAVASQEYLFTRLAEA